MTKHEETLKATELLMLTCGKWTDAIMDTIASYHPDVYEWKTIHREITAKLALLFCEEASNDEPR